ncbi:MAG TPA: hypothetical protein VKE51_22105 [Vicinamibacterales bacterium]|nr:hypothetical protein [Vicinamibacterales bacterium]
MTDIQLFDTGDVHDEAQHWDAFAARVTAEAMKRPVSVLQWLAGPRAAAVAMAFVIAALAIVFLATGDAQGDMSVREQWTRLLAPSDPVGRTIATGDRPPSVSRLFDDARGSNR